MPRRSDSITRQFLIIKRALAKLEGSLAKLQQSSRAAQVVTASPVARRRNVTMTPKRRAQLKLHGTYIGHLRHLTPKQKSQVKAVKAKKGYEAAIAAAKRMGSPHR